MADATAYQMLYPTAPAMSPAHPPQETLQSAWQLAQSLTLAPSLTLATLLEPDGTDDAPDGTYAYRGRLVGVVRHILAVQAQVGPILRLKGQFLFLRAVQRYGARSLVVPPELADEVRAAFVEHPRRSTRDHTIVHLNFDAWAIRDSRSALGYRLQFDGRAWVPDPFCALIAAALNMPAPPAPETRE